MKGISESTRRAIQMIYRNTQHKQSKCVWAYVREKNFFRDLMTDQNMVRLWPQYFCLTKNSFNHLLAIVGLSLIKEDTWFRQSIRVEMRVAIGVFRLATGNTFQSISYAFGVGKTTAMEICEDFEIFCLYMGGGGCQYRSPLDFFPKYRLPLLAENRSNTGF